MRDNLPRKIWGTESGIVNLDEQTGPGTHWTAYLKRGRGVLYFDSFGNLKPPLELIKYFGSDGSRNIITYNFDRYQRPNAHNCGHLCLQFLYSNSQ